MTLEVLLFTSPTCHWCPLIKQILEEFLTNCDQLELIIYDITEDISKAEEYSIIALPTVILPGNERIVGSADRKIFEDRLNMYCGNFERVKQR